MNFNIKDHHFTREIDTISGSQNGMILITFRPTGDFQCEHLIFLKDEIDSSTKDILLLDNPNKLG